MDQAPQCWSHPAVTIVIIANVLRLISAQRLEMARRPRLTEARGMKR